MLKEKGKQYVFTMYINRFFDMTNKQRDYVMNYKGDKNERNRNLYSSRKR